MNREIKFRLWDKIRKEMRKGCHNILIDSLDGKPYWQYGYDEAMPMVNYEVMQFTGLLDKNGKEIYEGDIVRPTTMNDGNLNLWKMVNGQAERRLIEIKWDEKFAQFEIQLPTGDLEVIGNRFENPELLK